MILLSLLAINAFAGQIGIGPVRLGSGSSTIAALSVDSTKLTNGSVDSEKLAKNSVDTEKINTDAVNTGKVLTDSITSPKILNGAVETSKLAADSVTSAKVINAAISTQKLATDSVDTSKIKTDSVTADKISNGAIGSAKLARDVAANSFTGAHLGDGSGLTGISGALTGGVSGNVPKWTGATTQGLSSIDNGTSSTTIYGATVTFSNTGIISAPSQSGTRIALVTNNYSFANGVTYKIYFDTDTAPGSTFLYNNQATAQIATSSETLTTRGAGIYSYGCCLQLGTCTTANAQYLIDVVGSSGAGSVLSRSIGTLSTINPTEVCTSGVSSLLNGNALVCRFSHNDAAATIQVQFQNNSGIASYFWLQKIW